MPPLGDLLFKLGSGEELGPGELNELRLGVNRIQGLIDHYDTFRYGLNPLDLSSEVVLGQMAHTGAKVTRITSQTITGGVYDNVEWTTKTGGGWDSDSFWDLDTDIERGTVPYSGIYLAIGYCRWDADATGHRS